MLALKDAQLLPKQPNLEIFLVIRAPNDGDEVEQDREDAAKDKEHHARGCCKDHADPEPERRNMVQEEDDGK